MGGKFIKRTIDIPDEVMTAQPAAREDYSLRRFLDQIAESGQLKTVEEGVSPNIELMDVMWELKRSGDSSAVWFDQVDDLTGEPSDFPVLVNLFGDRQRCAEAIDSTIKQVGLEYAQREKPENHHPPEMIRRDDAAVVDEVAVGEEVDLDRLPIVTSHEQDAGPYLTAGVCIIPAPPGNEEWGYNAAIIRMEYLGDNTLAAYAVSGYNDMDKYFDAYEEAGENMPYSITIGHHPAFSLGAQTSSPIQVNELHTIGGILGQPLKVTPSHEFGEDLVIPANAEIVLEGEAIADERVSEGPFGEFTGYYGRGGDNRWKVEINAVQHRSNAIYHHIWPGQADHLFLGLLPTEGHVLNAVKESVPSVQNVNFPPSGSGRFHCYLKIDKQRPGEGKNAIIAALSAFDWIKHVFVVDDDIDIFDEEEVLWAVATRSQWNDDLVLEDGFATDGFEPSARLRGVTARGGIDATRPLDEDYPDKLLPSDHDVDHILDSTRVAEDVPE